MKKHLVLFIVSLLFNFSFVNPSIAEDTDVNKKINIHVPFKLQIYEEGKPTEKYMVGILDIFGNNGKIEVYWSNVLLSPLHSQKIVLLKPEQFNTRNDVFENVSIMEDQFSFTMILPPYVNKIQIQGNRKRGVLFHSIKGEGVFKSLSSEGNLTKVEWRSVDKVILPYNQVK